MHIGLNLHIKTSISSGTATSENLKKMEEEEMQLLQRWAELNKLLDQQTRYIVFTY